MYGRREHRLLRQLLLREGFSLFRVAQPRVHPWGYDLRDEEICVVLLGWIQALPILRRLHRLRQHRQSLSDLLAIR